METNSTRNATLLPALLLIWALVFPTSSVAANPCATADGFLDIGIMNPTNDTPPRKGIGGTGRSGDEDDKGIGGTGRSIGDDDKGIGGTGAVGHDKGIGGTGQTAELIYVTGTIHAFGSVCVNGVEIEYTTDTPVSSNANQSIKTSSLQIGQVVDVIAEKGPGKRMPRAKNIAVRFPLQGPVTKISRDRRVINVMGKPVQLTGMMDGKSIGLGDRVRISGLKNTQGQVVASFIERMPGQGSARTTPSNTRVIPSNITNLSIQGYVQKRTPAGRVVIEGHKFDLGTRGKDIEVGQRLIVSGKRRPDGIIRASRWVHEKTLMGTRLQFDDTRGSGHRNRGRGRGGDHDNDKEDNSGPGRGKRPDDNDRIDNSGKGSDKSDRIDRPGNSGRGRGRSGRPERVERPDNSGRRDRPDRPDRPDNSGRRDRPERPDRSGRGGG